MDEARDTKSKRRRRRGRKNGANKDVAEVELVMRDSRRIPISAAQNSHQQHSSRSTQNMGYNPSPTVVQTAGTIPIHASHAAPVGPSVVGPVASMSNSLALGLPQPSRSGTIQVEESTAPSQRNTSRSWQIPQNSWTAVNRNYPQTVQNQPAYSTTHNSIKSWGHSPGLRQTGTPDPGGLPDQSHFTYHQYMTGNSFANWFPNMQFHAASPPYSNLGIAFQNPALQTLPPLQPHRSNHTMSTTGSVAGPGYVVPIGNEQWTEPPPTASTSQKQRLPSKRPEAPSTGVLSGSGRVTPPPAPVPTDEYLLQANQPPRRLQQPQHILLVIDLNGTLLHRPNRRSSTLFVSRPGIEQFLSYILSNFKIMIWSSSRAKNVIKMCHDMFTAQQHDHLIALWGRENLGLTEKQYNGKVQVYKRLEWVWEDADIAVSHPEFQQGGRWDQSNTVLIDDSILKAARQPHNILEVPEFAGEEELQNKDTLKKVAAYLEELRFHNDVSAFLRASPFVIDGSWRKDGGLL